MTSAREGAEATRDEVVEAVITASRALVGVAVRSIEATSGDVSLPQFRVLVVLAGHGSQRSVDLANLLGVTPSTTTRLCDRLVAKGLIVRNPVPGDRRTVRLEVTAAGAAVVTEVSTARRQDVARILRRVPAADRDQLVRSLGAFAQAAGELPEQDWAAGWS